MLATLLPVLLGVLAPPLASSSASAGVNSASAAQTRGSAAENAALQATPPPDLAALGVVLSPRDGASVAILRSGARTRVVTLGETAFGGRVAAISERGVSLDFSGTRVELRLPAAPSEPAPVTADARRPDPREAEGSRDMSRDEVQRRLAQETPRILSETTLVPVQDES